MVKYILFDLGGVLVPETGNLIRKGLSEFIGITLEKFSFELGKHKALATKGELSLLEVYFRIVESLSLDLSPKEILEKHLTLYKETSSQRDLEVLDLIEKLKRTHEIICLTNTESEIASYNRDGGLFDYFTIAFVSTDMGMMKPDKEIFLAVISKLGCKPTEIVFIDDNLDYIQGAKKEGIKTIHFKSVNQLLISLKAYGIRL